jgi:hypothetical protein
MSENEKMQEIPWSKCDIQDVGYHVAEGSESYFVFSCDYFGWAPSPMPFHHPWAFPGKYKVISSESIVHAEFEAAGLFWRCRIFLHVRDEEDECTLEFRVNFPHRWIRAFERRGIPVFEHNPCRLTTFRGVLHNFGLWILLGVEFMFLCALGTWWAFRRGQNIFEVELICLMALNACLAAAFYFLARGKKKGTGGAGTEVWKCVRKSGRDSLGK